MEFKKLESLNDLLGLVDSVKDMQRILMLGIDDVSDRKRVENYAHELTMERVHSVKSSSKLKEKASDYVFQSHIRRLQDEMRILKLYLKTNQDSTKRNQGRLVRTIERKDGDILTLKTTIRQNERDIEMYKENLSVEKQNMYDDVQSLSRMHDDQKSRLLLEKETLEKQLHQAFKLLKNRESELSETRKLADEAVCDLKYEQHYKKILKDQIKSTEVENELLFQQRLEKSTQSQILNEMDVLRAKIRQLEDTNLVISPKSPRKSSTSYASVENYDPLTGGNIKSYTPNIRKWAF